jgi:hypothetical protein
MAAYQLDLTLSNQLDQGIPRAHGTKMGLYPYVALYPYDKQSKTVRL